MSEEFNPYELTEPAETAPVARTKAPPVGKGVLCATCGYELSLLPREGVCPECGSPILRSLGGNELRHASPDYLDKLRIGSICIVSVFIIQVLFVLVAGVGTLVSSLHVLSETMMDVLSLIASIVLSAVSMYGWWLMTEKDPGAQDPSHVQTARTFVRVSVIAQAVMLTLTTLIDLVMFTPGNSGSVSSSGDIDSLMPILYSLSFIVMVVGYFAGLIYIRYIASRVPSESMMERARFVTWAPVVLVVALILIAVPILGIFVLIGEAIGWIVWFVRYVLLIDAVRAEAERARDIQLRGEPLAM